MSITLSNPEFQITSAKRIRYEPTNLDFEFLQRIEAKNDYEFFVTIDGQGGKADDWVTEVAEKVDFIASEYHGYIRVDDAHRWCEIHLALLEDAFSELFSLLASSLPDPFAIRASILCTRFDTEFRGTRLALVEIAPEIRFSAGPEGQAVQ